MNTDLFWGINFHFPARGQGVPAVCLEGCRSPLLDEPFRSGIQLGRATSGREMTGRWHSQVQGPALGSGSTTPGDLKGWRGDLVTSPPCARGLLWVQIRTLQYKFLGEQSCPLQQVA